MVSPRGQPGQRQRADQSRGQYRDGQGVPKNYAEALKWFRLAADQGNAFAQTNLGMMYYAGLGVPQDYVGAHMWFSLSGAQEGHQDAIKNREAVAQRMTPAQIGEAHKRAAQWQPKTANALPNEAKPTAPVSKAPTLQRALARHFLCPGTVKR